MSNKILNKKISSLINASVDDCKISLSTCSNPDFLCDLLIECRKVGHMSRENVVRQRISKLVRTRAK